MSNFVKGLIRSRIEVITIDGKVFIGILNSVDENLNIILSDCFEIIYSLNAPITQEKIGSYFIKSDNIAIINDNAELLIQDNFMKIKANPIQEFIL